jgi:hypothetical protein
VNKYKYKIGDNVYDTCQFGTVTIVDCYTSATSGDVVYEIKDEEDMIAYMTVSELDDKL